MTSKKKEEIIQDSNLESLVKPDGSVYILVQLTMYGLTQAGLLANELLEKCLNAHRYFQSKLVPGLWCHTPRPVKFSLVVNYFGVKYTGCKHMKHLLTVLEGHHNVTANWTGTCYIAILLNWDYSKRQVHLSMPGYVAKALKQFNHPKPTNPQHAPFPSMPINYGAKKQYATLTFTSPPLNKADKRFIQQV